MYNTLAAQEKIPCYTKIETDGTRDTIYIKIIEKLRDEAMIYPCSSDIFEINMEEIIKAELDINTIDDYGVLYGILNNVFDDNNNGICNHSSNDLEEDRPNWQALDEINLPSWFFTPYRRREHPQVVVISHASPNELQLVLNGTPSILTEKPHNNLMRNMCPGTR